MTLNQYKLKAEEDFTTFEFVSEGPRGKIIKVVQFQQVDETDVYNLAFGDINPLSGKLDDKIITDNGDSEKVLATVVAGLSLLFIRLQNNIQTFGRMLPEVQKQEQDYIGLELINTLILQIMTLIF